MSKEAVTQFREEVSRNEGLQAEIMNAGDLDIVSLARSKGFEFTLEELQDAVEAAADQLTDFELEMVAGGTSPGMAGNQGGGC